MLPFVKNKERTLLEPTVPRLLHSEGFSVFLSAGVSLSFFRHYQIEEPPFAKTVLRADFGFS